MPLIPIHKNAPIKPDGITPQTATEESPTPTRTIPATTPATTTPSATSQDPPAPQPGARPLAPTAGAAGGGTYNAASASSPPAPQPGYTAHHITTETRRLEGGMPVQFTQAPPSDAMLAGRSTVTSTTASASGERKAGPTTLNYGLAASPFQSRDVAAAPPAAETGGRSSLEHPPGYQQAPDNAPYTRGGGIGGQSGGSGEQGSGSGDGVGAAAWNILNKAGEALKKGEEAAWKAVRNK